MSQSINWTENRPAGHHDLTCRPDGCPFPAGSCATRTFQMQTGRDACPPSGRRSVVMTVRSSNIRARRCCYRRGRSGRSFNAAEERREVRHVHNDDVARSTVPRWQPQQGIEFFVAGRDEGVPAVEVDVFTREALCIRVGQLRPRAGGPQGRTSTTTISVPAGGGGNLPRAQASITEAPLIWIFGGMDPPALTCTAACPTHGGARQAACTATFVNL